MGLGTQFLVLLVCIQVMILTGYEIDLLSDIIQEPSKGLSKDRGEMVYCYQTRNGRSKFLATSHMKQHFVRDMKHSKFIVSAQIKLKELKGVAQFVLLSVQRTTDKKKLLILWMNAARKQVGITYIGKLGRTSLLYFANVPFETAQWFKITLKFRGFQKTTPAVELYVNEEKIESKFLSGSQFKDAIVKTPEENIDISLADMYGVTTAFSMPKICMKRLKVYTDAEVEDIVRKCPESAVTREDMVLFEQRITDRVKETYDHAISKMMQQMETMLNTCGVCGKRPPTLVERPPPKGTGPKAVKPVENKAKQVLKSILVPAENPCPPGLNECHPSAKCTPNVLASGNHCKCNLGFAGNGYQCGKDSDLDGYPDEELANCIEKQCRKDNCKEKPNSGQENADGDRYGDACDRDMDNDGILNRHDSCPLVYNPRQVDSDDDRIGDACDNCVNTRNRDQKDTDKNGKGDACTDDIDGDGIIEGDNCPYKPNKQQQDSDKDGVGNACDNCPFTYNPRQKDADQDLLGDKCDDNIDRDKDGVNDRFDNCKQVINPGQLDTDGDGKGDACDDDDDNDGISDEKDNCKLTPNKDQKVDPNSPKYGIACKDDYDGDNVLNNVDSCPENKGYSAISFNEYQTINLDPKEEEQIDPKWKVLDGGREIQQALNSDPGMAIGLQSFRGLDYYGTVYVDSDSDDDYLGLIFGFQSSSQFYTIMWKKVGQTYWDKEPSEAHGETGLSIKVVNSKTGPGPELRNALWHTNSTEDEVRLLWHDKNEIGWTAKTPYHWELKHRPRTGYLRLKIYEGTNTLIDSGVLYDNTYKGGRIGMMSFSQEQVRWSKIYYRCNDGSVNKL